MTPFYHLNHTSTLLLSSRMKFSKKRDCPTVWQSKTGLDFLNIKNSKVKIIVLVNNFFLLPSAVDNKAGPLFLAAHTGDDHLFRENLKMEKKFCLKICLTLRVDSLTHTQCFHTHTHTHTHTRAGYFLYFLTFSIIKNYFFASFRK